MLFRIMINLCRRVKSRKFFYFFYFFYSTFFIFSIREEERMSTSYYDKYSNQSSFVNSQEDDLPLNVLHVYDGTENAG